MYLEKLEWLKKIRSLRSVDFFSEKSFPKKIVLTGSLICCLFVSGLFLLPEDSPVLRSVYKNTLGVAYAAVPGKVLRLYIKRGYALLFKGGLFPLGNELSIVDTREPIKIPLDGVRFAVYNVEKRYFDFPATDWIYPSRLVAKGLKKEAAFALENLGSAFRTVPYFTNRVVSSAKTKLEPYLFPRQKLKRWKRKFADGKIRTIVPKDNWFCLRPNVFGKVRAGKIDRKLSIPSLQPEESLPVAFYVFTNLCNWKTGEWNLPLVQWLVSCNYAFAYGIYLDPQKIYIKGKGVRTRFYYEGETPVDLGVISSFTGAKEIVPLISSQGELFFYASWDPSQSIFIPFSYLWKMDDKKDKIFLAGGTLITSMREIKEELYQIRLNKNKRVKFDGENLQSYVVFSPRLREVANRLVGSKNRQKGIAVLADYTNVAMPYVSDGGGEEGKRNLVEIPYPPTLAVMNRGGDCEDHAILFASLFLSSCLPNSQSTALAIVSYRINHEGHVIPMVPMAGELELDPFPNFVVFGGVPYNYIEATGYGYNKLHQTKPTLNGYQPLWAEVIHQHGCTRSVLTFGFNQFRYDLVAKAK
jgi:hypothetical protein